MDIRLDLREALLEYDIHEGSQLLTEATLMDIIQKIVEFFKKNWDKLKYKLLEKKDDAILILENTLEAAGMLARGEFMKSNPDYKQARKKIITATSDLGKLVAFFGTNIILNILVPSLGVGFGASVLYLRDKLPKQLEWLTNFLKLSIEKAEEEIENEETGEEKSKTNVEEFFALFEDMSYYHVGGDATQDEYKIGLEEGFYFNDGRFNKSGANTLYNNGEEVVNFGVGDVGSFELNGQQFNNALYLKGGYHSAKKGGGTLGIKTIFEKLPKIENIVLECFDNVVGFWTHIGGDIVNVRQNKNGDNVNTVVINRASFQ
jgi:hypothetical protein